MAILLAGILLIGFMVRIPYVNFPIDEDIGYFTYLAHFRKRGVRFVKDYFGWLTPVIIYLYLFPSKLFGGDIRYVRHFSNIYNLLNILSTFIVTNYLFGTTPAIIAALVYAIFSSSPYLGVYSCHAEGFYIFPVALGVLAVAKGVSDGHPIYILYSGGFFAAAFLLKIVNVIYFASFLLFLLAKYEAAYSLYFSISFIAIILLHSLLIALLYKGENSQLLFQHRVRWKTCLGYIDNSVRGMWKRFKVDFSPIWRETWGVFILSSVFLMYLPFKLSAVSHQLLAVWLFSTVFILSSQMVFRMYHYIPFVQLASILSALIITTSSFILYPLSFILLIPNIYYKLRFMYLYRKDKRLLYFQKADQFFYIPEIAKYIKERTAPDEYIYVWGPFVQIYRLADRLSCERFVFHFVRPYTMWHTYLFDEILTGIISKEPAYIVIVRPDFNTEILRQITGLDYELEKVFFNRYRIYRLKGRVSEPMKISYMREEDKIKWLEYLTPGSMNYRIDDYYLKKGMYEEAYREFEEGLRLNPLDIWMKLGMASLFRVQRRYDNAFRLYQEIENNKREKEWLYLEKGIAFREMGDMENALKEFENEERLYPKADIHHQRGITYRMQCKFKEALKEFNKALAIDPKAEWVHHEIGITYKEIGDMENAVKELEFEDSLYPGKAITKYNLYSVYEENGRRGFARNGYNMLLENRDVSDNFKAGCYFHLGKIYAEDNKTDEAIKFFKGCLKLMPEHKKAAEYLGQLMIDSEVTAQL